MKFLTQKDINEQAKIIEKEAVKYIHSNLEKKAFIDTLRQQQKEKKLFEYCIEQCSLDNGYLTISYILNTQFDTAEARGNFGNCQDANGNTLYHHAAMADNAKLMYVLSAQKKTAGKECRIRFVIPNTDKKTPLDVCCQFSKQQAFTALWPRAGHPNHVPAVSLLAACKGGNTFIVATILKHEKTKPLHIENAITYAISENISTEIKLQLQQAINKLALESEKLSTTDNAHQEAPELNKKRPFFGLKD